MNQFGGIWVVHIVKDRTFFYMNYEGLRQSIGDTQERCLCAERGGPCPGLSPRHRRSRTSSTHFQKDVAPYAVDPQWTDQTLPYGTDRTRED